MSKELSAGIIGAGMMGIHLARRLSSEGFHVTLIEGASAPGGLAGSAKFGDYTWDRFYHVILPGDRLTLNLVSDLGLEPDLFMKETKTGFYVDGKFYSMSNTWEFVKFPVISFPGKIRLALTILAGSLIKDYRKLETIPVTDWLVKWSGRKVFTKIWLPLLKAKLGNSYEGTSAAFICATIKRLYGARKKGAKKETFGYVKGGYARVLHKVTERLSEENIELKTGFKVSEILHMNNDFVVKSRDGRQEKFDCVISTLPSFITSSLCPQLMPEEHTSLQQVQYLGVICVSMLLKRSLTSFYVTNIADESIPFTGVIEMTALVDREQFGGNSLVYLPKYVHQDDEIFETPDERIVESFTGWLKMMHPSLKDEDILESRVARARQVISMPQMGYSGKLPSFRTSLKGLYIVNSSFITDGTLNINETLRVAEAHLPAIISDLRNEE